MRIDAHQHFWRYHPQQYDWIDDSMQPLRHDFLPHDLRPQLERAGFDGSIAVQACHSLDETRWLLELASRSPFLLGVVGWVDLRSPDLRGQLSEFSKHKKFVGVRHVVQSEPDDRFLLRPDFMRGIAALEEFNLSYDILIYPKHLQVAAELVEHFPRQRFVLDHMAKPPIKSGALEPWATDFRRLAKLQNVFCKVSGLVTEADWKGWKPDHLKPYLEVAFESFGPERLMIGSDWPVCTVAAPYSLVMNTVMDFVDQFAGRNSAAVLGGTAAAFWKLLA
ncbi:MAG TPA: amidohydrolase family protein [Terriglobales bacterium]